MRFFCDDSRHLVCLPYSVEDLHRAAKELGIARHWFHGSKTGLHHYDIPKRMLPSVMARCEIVSSREIVSICRGKTTALTRLVDGLVSLSREKFDETR